MLSLQVINVDVAENSLVTVVLKKKNYKCGNKSVIAAARLKFMLRYLNRPKNTFPDNYIASFIRIKTNVSTYRLLSHKISNK